MAEIEHDHLATAEDPCSSNLLPQNPSIFLDMVALLDFFLRIHDFCDILFIYF